MFSSFRSNKIKRGKKRYLYFINLLQNKFEKSLIIEEGIYFYIITKLIIVDGTMNNFVYGQTI